jgi:hypothetical protein
VDKKIRKCVLFDSVAGKTIAAFARTGASEGFAFLLSNFFFLLSLSPMLPSK